MPRYTKDSIHSKLSIYLKKYSGNLKMICMKDSNSDSISIVYKLDPETNLKMRVNIIGANTISASACSVQNKADGRLQTPIKLNRDTHAENELEEIARAFCDCVGTARRALEALSGTP